MRYELTDCAWRAIRPMLPNKPRGVPRVDDRRISQRHILGLAIRCALAGGEQACGIRSWMRWPSLTMRPCKMIDTSVVRVHQHGACIAGNRQQQMGRSHGVV